MLSTAAPGLISSRRLQAAGPLVIRALFPLALFLIVIGVSSYTYGQTLPLPAGSVEFIGGQQGWQNAKPCNPASGWLTGTTCVQATMHCDTSLNVDDITFTFGYEAPSAPYKGTVVVFSGDTGEKPATSKGQEIPALQAYLNAGFEIVQVAWISAWEQSKITFTQGTYGNIQYAACRPAGLLNFVNTTPALFQAGNGAGMCAHGFSAGSAAIVYSLAWYGAGWGLTGYLDNVELLSGPVLSQVDTGCMVPIAANVMVCSGPPSPGCRMKPGQLPWDATPEYIDGDETYVRSWSNIGACANTNNTNTSQWNPTWNNMSILSSAITPQQLSYPSTSMNAWLCSGVYDGLEPMNNSSSQGWLFYQQASFASGWRVNAMTSCDGNEGVLGTDAVGPDGNSGLQDITTDMETQCFHRTH